MTQSVTHRNTHNSFKNTALSHTIEFSHIKPHIEAYHFIHIEFQILISLFSIFGKHPNTTLTRDSKPLVVVFIFTTHSSKKNNDLLYLKLSLKVNIGGYSKPTNLIFEILISTCKI